MAVTSLQLYQRMLFDDVLYSHSGKRMETYALKNAQVAHANAINLDKNYKISSGEKNGN